MQKLSEAHSLKAHPPNLQLPTVAQVGLAVVLIQDAISTYTQYYLILDSRSLYQVKKVSFCLQMASQVALVVKNPPANEGDTRDMGSIHRSGRSPGEGVGYPVQFSWASLVAYMVNNPPAMRRPVFNLWVGKISWRRAWQPTPVVLPRESPWTEKPGMLQFMGLQRVGHG